MGERVRLMLLATAVFCGTVACMIPYALMRVVAPYEGDGRALALLLTGALGLSAAVALSVAWHRQPRASVATWLKDAGLCGLPSGAATAILFLQPQPLLVPAIFPILVLAGRRRGLSGAIAANAGFALVAAVLTLRGQGPIAGTIGGTLPRWLYLQLDCLTALLVTLPLTRPPCRHQAADWVATDARGAVATLGHPASTARPFDLRALIGDLHRAYCVEAARRDLELTLDLPGTAALWVAGDAASLRQALAMLIDNALTFTPSGAILIHVRHQPIAEHRGRWRFEIVDSGIGIEPWRLSTLFARVIDPGAPGDGLTSLARCHDLVAAMGGTVGADSLHGCGAVFTVVLDLETIRAPAAPTGEDLPRQTLPPMAAARP